VVAALLLAIAAVFYLSGYFLLWSLGQPPREARLLTAVRYAHYFGDRVGIRQRLLVCSASSAAMVVASVAVCCWPPTRKLHGNARYAHRGEIAAAGLLGDEGFLLGEIGGRYLLLPGQQGISLAAPPRSGKGVSIVVPNCLNWPGSLICNDVKLENYRLTAGYRRAAGQAVFLFDPLNEERRTARWNPFTYVCETSALRINDLQRIAAMLYPEVPGTDPFWVASARSLFLGISLYLFETPSALKTIGEVLRQGMASDDEGFGKPLAADRRRPPQRTAPTVAGVCSRAIRHYRSGSCDSVQCSQDVHLPFGPVAKPHSGCCHLIERLRLTRPAAQAYVDLCGA